MHGGEAHTATLIELNIEGHSLEGGGAHTAHVLDKVLCGDCLGSRGLDDETLGATDDRGVVGAAQLDGEGLADAGDDTAVDRAFASDGPFECRLGGIEGGLTTDERRTRRPRAWGAPCGTR